MMARLTSVFPKAVCILSSKEIITGNEHGKFPLQKIASDKPTWESSPDRHWKSYPFQLKSIFSSELMREKFTSWIRFQSTLPIMTTMPHLLYRSGWQRRELCFMWT